MYSPKMSKKLSGNFVEIWLTKQVKKIISEYKRIKETELLKKLFQLDAHTFSFKA